MRTVASGLVALTVTVAACGGGGGTDGELRISGNVTLAVGSRVHLLLYGVALPPGELSTAELTVLLSPDKVDCSTNPLGALPRTYVKLDPTSLSPMDYPALSIGIAYEGDTGSSHFNAKAGRVEITAVTAMSVAGSIEHMSDSPGALITVTGTFEVVRCF